MARILLVRHAPTPETGNCLTGRTPGVSLGGRGKKDAEAAAAALAGLEAAAVYTSPIERTLETAQIIARPHGLSPIIDQGLIEIDFGAWTGQPFEALEATELWKTVQRRPSRVRFPGGESFVSAQVRAVESIERIAEAHSGQTAVAVSHCDVIKLILSHFLGQPLDLFQRIHIDTASVSDLRVRKDGPWSIAAVNASKAGS